MLWWMCGQTRRDKICNDIYEIELSSSHFQEIGRKSFKVFWTCQKKINRFASERVDQTIWSLIKRGGRPKQTLGELIEQNLSVDDIPKSW